MACGYPGYPRIKKNGPILDVSSGCFFVHLVNLAIHNDLNIKTENIFTEIRVPALTNGGKKLDIWPMYLHDLMEVNELLFNNKSFSTSKSNLVSSKDELFSVDICGNLMLRSYRGKGITYKWDALSQAYNKSKNFDFGED